MTSLYQWYLSIVSTADLACHDLTALLASHSTTATIAFHRETLSSQEKPTVHYFTSSHVNTPLKLTHSVHVPTNFPMATASSMYLLHNQNSLSQEKCQVFTPAIKLTHSYHSECHYSSSNVHLGSVHACGPLAHTTMPPITTHYRIAQTKLFLFEKSVCLFKTVNLFLNEF